MNNQQSHQSEIQLTAAKSQSRRVWTSYGIATCLYPFILPHQVCGWQQLNRFHYESAISRVQTRINTLRYHYLAYPHKGLLSNKAIQYS